MVLGGCRGGPGNRVLPAGAQVVDASGGPEWSRWFTGALVNGAHNCVYRHALGDRASQPSIIWEGEDGVVRRLTYRELADAVSRLAGALDALGARRGERVGLYLPMLPKPSSHSLRAPRSAS